MKESFIIMTLPLYRIILAAISILFAAGVPCGAVRYYVDAGSTAVVRDGSSWAKAFKKIGDAVAVAKFGSEIWVKAGVYQEPPLVLNSYLWLYGGFIGFETKQEYRIPGAFPSIIDVDRQGSVITVARDKRCTIDGFTIRNGFAMYGGGLNCQTNSVVNMRNCRIEGCEATYAGGGAYFGTYAPMDFIGGLTDCVVIGNTSAQGGGVVIEYHCAAVLTRCLIIRNHATSNGGGVYCPFHCDGRMYYCTVAYNSAGETSGGAYVHYGGNVAFTNSIFAFNSAPTSGGLGGGGGTNSLQYSYCNLFGNQGGDWGGNILDPSRFLGNYSADPRFIAPERDEFHLWSNSPCTSAGCFAVESPYRIERIGVAKSLPTGTSVRLRGKIVSGVRDGITYIQEHDRAAAIAVTGLSGYTSGQVLRDITGVISGDVRTLAAGTTTTQAGFSYPFKPLGTNVSSIATLTGMMSRTWGRVTGLTVEGFVINDGRTELQVIASGASVGDFVVVTGVYALDGKFAAVSVVRK